MAIFAIYPGAGIHRTYLFSIFQTKGIRKKRISWIFLANLKLCANSSMHKIIEHGTCSNLTLRLISKGFNRMYECFNRPRSFPFGTHVIQWTYFTSIANVKCLINFGFVDIGSHRVHVHIIRVSLTQDQEDIRAKTIGKFSILVTSTIQYYLCLTIV